MMSSAFQAIHVLGAAVWVGGMFFALLVLRPSLAALEPPQRMALHLQVFRRFFLVVWHAMPLVLLSGYAIIHTRYGGFVGLSKAVHAMHAGGLAMAIVFLVIFFGFWPRLRRGERVALDAIRWLITLNLLIGMAVIAVAAFA